MLHLGHQRRVHLLQHPQELACRLAKHRLRHSLRLAEVVGVGGVARAPCEASERTVEEPSETWKADAAAFRIG